MDIIGNLLQTLQDWSNYPRNIKNFVDRDVSQPLKYTLILPEFFWLAYYLASNSQVYIPTTVDEIYKLDVIAYENYDSYQAVWWLLILNNIDWLKEYTYTFPIIIPKPEAISKVLDNYVIPEDETPINPVQQDIEVF